MALPGPALAGAASLGIAHTIPRNVWINILVTDTEWRAIKLFFLTSWLARKYELFLDNEANIRYTAVLQF